MTKEVAKPLLLLMIGTLGCGTVGGQEVRSGFGTPRDVAPVDAQVASMEIVLAPTAPTYTVMDAIQGNVELTATLTNTSSVLWTVAHPSVSRLRQGVSSRLLQPPP